MNLLWSLSRRVFQSWLSFAIFACCLSSLPFVGLGGNEISTFWSGIPRVGASFFAGVLVYHLKERRFSATEMNIAFWFSALTMALLFYYPKPVTFLTSMAWVALVSPTVVLSGAGVRLSGKGRALALSGGALSYPIYALHYPIFCWINGFYQVFAARHHGVLIEGPLLLAGLVLGSYFALKSFDEPLRHAPQ